VAVEGITTLEEIGALKGHAAGGGVQRAPGRRSSSFARYRRRSTEGLISGPYAFQPGDPVLDEEWFPQTRVRAGCAFRKETIVGMRHNGRDAPKD